MNIKSPKTIACVFFAAIVLISLGSIMFFNRIKPTSIILNDYSASRLGDQLVGYSKAKWLSYKYGIPFQLIPFKGCEHLNVSKEQHYTSISNFFNRIFYKFYGRPVRINSEEELITALATSKKPTRFLVHMSTRLCEHSNNNIGLDPYDNAWIASALYECMRQNPIFSQELKKMLQPITPIDHMRLPKDRITVAVHVRKGGGFDPQLLSQQYFSNPLQATHYEQFYITPNIAQNITSYAYDLKTLLLSSDKQWPDKFPPEQYYVNEIQNISNFFDNAPLYVYIFTDDKDPVGLMKRIEKNTDKQNIVFDCRKGKNSHDTNVIYDMYAMADFDCLIRSGSHFAYISQLVGNHTIVVYPLHLKWIESEILLVDRVGVIIQTKKPSQKNFGHQEKKG